MTRDAAGSAPPPQLRLVKTTPHFTLWRRQGEVRERSLLEEGEWPGQVLECGTRSGRAVLAGGGVAAVRPLPLLAPVPAACPGSSVAVEMTLRPGAWELQVPYTSPQPVQVSSPLLHTTLPANLDRPGPRWRLGRVVVRKAERFAFTFQVEDTPLASPATPAVFNALIAVPQARESVVPTSRACGRYVDWYRGSSG
jgi:hypothetical protein